MVVLVSGLKSLFGVYFGVMLHGGQLYGIKSTKGRLCNVSFKFFTDFFWGGHNIIINALKYLLKNPTNSSI